MRSALFHQLTDTTADPGTGLSGGCIRTAAIVWPGVGLDLAVSGQLCCRNTIF
jgi:hypothetical protein